MLPRLRYKSISDFLACGLTDIMKHPLNFVDFISGLLFSLEFSHAFSGEFDGMGGVDYAVKDSVSHSRIPHHVVLCRGRILGCDDY